MLINLTGLPTGTELEFLNRVFTSGAPAVCMVTGSALPLIFRQKPFNAECVVRTADANKLGGTIHSSWQLISDDEWLTLTETHKTVSW